MITPVYGYWLYISHRQEGPLVVSMKISPCTKKGTSYLFFATKCDEMHIMSLLNPILDIPIRT